MLIIDWAATTTATPSAVAIFSAAVTPAAQPTVASPGEWHCAWRVCDIGGSSRDRPDLAFRG
jgi:hypothetical protein